MTWWTYVERISATSRQRDIAERTGIDPANVSRWKSGSTPAAQTVALFARGYKRPVLEAFVAAGFLTPEEAEVRPVAAPDLTRFTNDELLELVRARMREEGDRDDRPAATKTPGSGPGVRYLPTAARDTGELSKGQKDRAAASLAGEPPTDDPDDMEPR